MPTIETKTLAVATKLCAAAAGKTGILTTALLDHRDGVLTLTATDYDVTMRCTVPTDGGDVWTLAVPAAALRDVVGALADLSVTLEAEGAGGLRVQTARSVYRLTTQPAADWPAVDVVDVGADAPALPDLSPVAVAMSSDESRPALNGVNVGGAVAVATDGHRLHVLDVPAALTDAGTMHRRGVDMLPSLPGPLRFAVEGRLVGVAGDGCTLTLRRVEDAYPDWSRVMPEVVATPVVIGIDPLRVAVRQASALSAGRHALLRLEVSGGELRLSSTHPDLGDSSVGVACEYDGADLGPIGMNPRYLLDALGALDACGGDVVVRVSIVDQFSPVLLTAGCGRMVVMPMRV